jgi:hypothetical protein
MEPYYPNIRGDPYVEGERRKMKWLAVAGVWILVNVLLILRQEG